ncbi:MAG TPA: hypothetical protein VF173_32175 [Thermoanaerobaculia bacterium]|nr:hypothetical protein [Thermoanaerobaculia bacterium]
MHYGDDCLLFFEAPCQTRFVLDAQSLWMGYGNTEGLLDASDLHEFLFHTAEGSNLSSFTTSDDLVRVYIENDTVHVFGRAGTEAVFPLDDLAAFIRQLDTEGLLDFWRIQRTSSRR